MTEQEIGFMVLSALVGVVWAGIRRELRGLARMAAHHQTALVLICDKLNIKLGD